MYYVIVMRDKEDVQRVIVTNDYAIVEDFEADKSANNMIISTPDLSVDLNLMKSK